MEPTDRELPATEAIVEQLTDTAPRQRAKKDRKTWCKGKPNRHHTPTIQIPVNSYTYPFREKCRWIETSSWHKTYYACSHAEVCSACGKILRSRDWMSGDLAAQECPFYVPPPDPAVPPSS